MSVTAEQRVNTEMLKSAGDTTEHAHSASQPEQVRTTLVEMTPLSDNTLPVTSVLSHD